MVARALTVPKCPAETPTDAVAAVFGWQGCCGLADGVKRGCQHVGSRELSCELRERFLQPQANALGGLPSQCAPQGRGCAHYVHCANLTESPRCQEPQEIVPIAQQAAQALHVPVRLSSESGEAVMGRKPYR